MSAQPRASSFDHVPSLSNNAVDDIDYKADLDNKGEVEHGERQDERPKPAYTEYTLMETAKAFWKAVLFASLVAVGAMYDAYVVSVPQNLLANPGFTLQMGTVYAQGALQIAPNVITIWGVLYQVGSLIALLIVPALSDRFGRKICLWAMTLALIGDALIGIFAKDWQTFCGARILSGIAAGTVQLTIPNYISEVASAKIRGSFSIMYAIGFAVGGLLGTVMLNEIANRSPMDYKWAFISEFFVLGLFLPGLIFSPETPVFHAKRGNEEKAKRAMRRLYSTEPSFDVDYEYLEMVALIETERSTQAAAGKSSWREYLQCFRGTDLRRTIISFLPMVMQQMSGLVVFLGFAAFFFAQAGYEKPFEASVIIQAVLLAFVCLSFVVVDKVGRRPLLLGGIAVIIACNFAMGGMGFMEKSNGPAMIFVSCVWAAAYSLSLGPLGWTYVSEVSSTTLRAKTIGLAIFMTQAFNLIWSYTIPLMLSPAANNWGLKTSLLFGGCAAVVGTLVFFVVPETKGRSYEQLDHLFVSKVPTRRFKSYRFEDSQARAPAEV